MVKGLRGRNVSTRHPDSVISERSSAGMASAPAERRRDFFGRLAVLEDVLRVVDGSARAPERRQLRGKEFLPVEKDIHAVARNYRSPGVSAERRRERRLPRLEMR